MRPVLVPARRLWRDRQTLQLRLPSSQATVLGPLDNGCRAVLALLDGTRTHAEVLAQAPRAGCPTARAHELLDVLGTAGLLLDGDGLHAGLVGLERDERARLAPDLASLALVRGPDAGTALAARRRSRVHVYGGGRVGAPLAALLSAAGVGEVEVRDDGTARLQDTVVGGLTLADVGRPRGPSVTERLPRPVSGRSDLPDVVVLTGADLDDLDDTAAALVRIGTTHLVARVREDVGQVGPLVIPGRSACLGCLDLERSSLDPGWPALAVQLAQEPRGQVACDGVLAVAVAAQAALQVLALLEGFGTPASVGGTLELELPGWRWRRRSWPQQPDCPCAWVGTDDGEGAWAVAAPGDGPPSPMAAAG